MIDLSTGNNNKMFVSPHPLAPPPISIDQPLAQRADDSVWLVSNWAMTDKQEMIDIIETVYRGASKGRGLVVAPKGTLLLQPCPFNSSSVR
jgi:hypothetical protein